MSQSAAFHDGLHVGKVQIDERGHGDQVADALNALPQHIVRNAEGFQHGRALGDHLQQTVVGDHDQRIHPLLQVDHAHFGVLHALLALKQEGLSDHGDGQAVQIPGDLGHDGSRARTRASTHTGGDKYQIRALDRLSDLLTAFLRGTAAHIRNRARAKTLSQFFTDLNGGAGLAHGQRLTIGIDGDKFHTLQARVHHAVDCVIACAAAADYLDRSKALLILDLKFKHSASP